MGEPAIESLDLITVKIIGEVTTKEESPLIKDIIEEFKEVFEGLGLVKGRPIHIELDDQVTPFHITAPRKVPIPLLEQLKTELERITKMGVIEKVEEPSEWCHPILVAIKPSGKIILCIDLTKLNKATKQELYQLDSTVETLAKLGTK